MEADGGTTLVAIPTGERMLAGLRTYFAGIPQFSLGSPYAVIIACDVSGYEDPKIREFTRKIAGKGYYVVVPDFCRGDPFLPDPPGGGGRPFADWLEDHDPSGDALEDAKLVSKILGYSQKGIGAIGVGWGAKVVAELTMPWSNDYAYHINSAVLLDPFSVTLDDFKGGYVPTLVSGAEINHDHASSQSCELFRELSDSLSTKSEIVRLVKLFPNVANRWSLGQDSDHEEGVREDDEEVLADVFDWLSKHMRRSPDPREFRGAQNFI
ncbi:hypothetical protein MLD38_036119 [Melastoma candidum]|uniref:Uncharacterized protein n=1 Tax=Melastoma candidum TaxID=119954 RepID=A0ACB9LI34_9MYRT|nr:hypothetical protein MLD38_036119 [Melastoma candidum]